MNIPSYRKSGCITVLDMLPLESWISPRRISSFPIRFELLSCLSYDSAAKCRPLCIHISVQARQVSHH